MVCRLPASSTRPPIMTLNVPAEERLAQLRLNALRVQSFAKALTDRYILVNIPAATIETVEAGQVFQRHTAVVGRIDRQTPILTSKVYQIKFNPYWTVPKSIIRRDLIKYMNEDPGLPDQVQYPDFRRQRQRAQSDRYRLVDRRSGQLHVPTGPGQREFARPCARSISTTPTTSICTTRRQSRCSARTQRFHSSGCVRVDRGRCPGRVDPARQWRLGHQLGRCRLRLERTPRRLGEESSADPHDLHHRLGQSRTVSSASATTSTITTQPAKSISAPDRSG